MVEIKTRRNLLFYSVTLLVILSIKIKYESKNLLDLPNLRLRESSITITSENIYIFLYWMNYERETKESAKISASNYYKSLG